MKILKKDYKHNYVKMQIENLDDLWYLTYIIEPGDILTSKTQRKLKLGGEDQRNAKVVKRTVLLSIEVEKAEFAKYSNILRVNGIIRKGPEDIPLGSYHTINLAEKDIFSLRKEQFLRYQRDKLEESAKQEHSNILICVHDREQASFAVLKKYGYDMVASISANPKKKADVKTESDELFPMIKKAIKEYDDRSNYTSIIIASPGFWREYIQKLITDEELKKKIVYATCSTAGESGVQEVIKREEVQKVLREEKFAEETEKVEALLAEISTQGKAEYGLEQVKKVTEAGAVNELLITDAFIHKKRQDEQFEPVEYIMRKVDQMGGDIHIISAEHEGGKKLDGLGGIAALLRYKINY